MSGNGWPTGTKQTITARALHGIPQDPKPATTKCCGVQAGKGKHPRCESLRGSKVFQRTVIIPRGSDAPRMCLAHQPTKPYTPLKIPPMNGEQSNAGFQGLRVGALESRMAK